MWKTAGTDLVLKALWTDTPYALQRVQGMFEAGTISERERNDLAHFIDHGWLVWRGAIEAELIDRFATDVRSHHRHPGMFVTTDHRNNGLGLTRSGSVPDRFESLFDLYVNLASARAVCLHACIARFLSLVFDTPPVACQQLLFQRSNGHRVHQDTSVVAVEEPLLLVATWIALEDIVPGSGELGYYDRSHRLPHYLFMNGTKRMDPAVDDRELYARELQAACEQAGMPYHRFLAKKGDVFFWTADLVHCSHPRTLPPDTSRLSCVTHYHPATTEPFWFRYHPDRKASRSMGNLGSYVSSHYDLSQPEGRMIPPASA